MEINNMEIFFLMSRQKVGYKILYIPSLIQQKQNMHMKKVGKKTDQNKCLCESGMKRAEFFFFMFHIFYNKKLIFYTEKYLK